MIVADTGAILALLDSDEKHHPILRKQFEEQQGDWLLPWAILPEVDYLASTQLGPPVAQAFLADLADGVFAIEWGNSVDLVRAKELTRKYRTLQLGLTDAVVIAVAERVRADAIATLDLRHFGTVKIRGTPKLLPRDL